MVEGNAISIPPGEQYSVIVSCRPTNAGMIRSLLSLVFDTPADDASSRFVIGRYVDVRVGDKTIIERLKPTAPYQKKKKQKQKRAPRYRGRELPGERPSFDKPSTWAVPLPFFNMPEAVEAQIKTGEMDDKLEILLLICRQKTIRTSFSCCSGAKNFSSMKISGNLT